MAHCCNCCPVLNGRNTKKIVLLLVGLDNAGKTTAARTLVGGTTEDVIPTVGFSTVKLKHRGMDIIIYDLGGGSQIRAIWKSYFSDVHGVIFVLDASDASRLEECKTVLENLLRNERLAGKPVLVLANKQDKPGALDQVDLVESLRLESLVNEQKCLTLIEECSAINHSQRNRVDPRILNGYRWLVNQIANDYDSLNSRVEQDKKVAAEKFAAHRKELRNRLKGKGDDSVEIPYMNGGSEKLPYKNNIIQVSPPPGVVVTPTSDEARTSPDEKPVASITRHIKEQLEMQGVKERHKLSLNKKNKVLPAMNGDAMKGGRRPKSEPYKPEVALISWGADEGGSSTLLSVPGHSEGLPPLKATRPLSSWSLGHEDQAWDLKQDLGAVSPQKQPESSQVHSFNYSQPSSLPPVETNSSVILK